MSAAYDDTRGHVNDGDDDGDVSVRRERESTAMRAMPRRLYLLRLFLTLFHSLCYCWLLPAHERPHLTSGATPPCDTRRARSARCFYEASREP